MEGWDGIDREYVQWYHTHKLTIDLAWLREIDTDGSIWNSGCKIDRRVYDFEVEGGVRTDRTQWLRERTGGKVKAGDRWIDASFTCCSKDQREHVYLWADR
jgi:hypothetical protein